MYVCVCIYIRTRILYSLLTEKSITDWSDLKKDTKKPPLNPQTRSTIWWISMSGKQFYIYWTRFHEQEKGETIWTKAYHGDLFSQRQARESEEDEITRKIVK